MLLKKDKPQGTERSRDDVCTQAGAVDRKPLGFMILTCFFQPDKFNHLRKGCTPKRGVAFECCVKLR